MYIFPFIRIRYIKTITINIHIDCLNNSKCSVRDILLATKQGAFESVFGTFSVIGKRRNVYNTDIDDTYGDHPTTCIDHVPDSPYGGIDLPPDEFLTEFQPKKSLV